jgi:hypothetical protein
MEELRREREAALNAPPVEQQLDLLQGEQGGTGQDLETALRYQFRQTQPAG